MLNRKDVLEIAAEIQALGEQGKKYTLIGPRVAIMRDDAPDQIGKIFVPETAKERMLSGTIVMLGNGLDVDEKSRQQYAGLSIGQWATFNKYNGVLHSIYLPASGRKIAVEILHALDLYIVWDGDSEESPFDEVNHITAVHAAAVGVAASVPEGGQGANPSPIIVLGR